MQRAYHNYVPKGATAPVITVPTADTYMTYHRERSRGKVRLHRRHACDILCGARYSRWGLWDHVRQVRTLDELLQRIANKYVPWRATYRQDAAKCPYSDFLWAVDVPRRIEFNQVSDHVLAFSVIRCTINGWQSRRKLLLLSWKSVTRFWACHSFNCYRWRHYLRSCNFGARLRP